MLDCVFCAVDWVGKGLIIQNAFVADKPKVKAVSFFFNLLSGKAVPAFVLNRRTVFCGVGFDEVGKMLFFELVCFAKTRHIGAKVIEPYFFCIVLVCFSSGKEKHVCLYALINCLKGWQILKKVEFRILMRQ